MLLGGRHVKAAKSSIYNSVIESLIRSGRKRPCSVRLRENATSGITHHAWHGLRAQDRHLPHHLVVTWLDRCTQHAADPEQAEECHDYR